MKKCALITGANRGGVGLALVEAYLAAGWQVNACCRRTDNAIELKQLQANTDSVTLHELDITDHQAIAALSQELADIPPLTYLSTTQGTMGPRAMASVTQMR